MSGMAIPLYDEEMKKKVVRALKKEGLTCIGDYENDETGEVICALVWPNIREFMIYRYFDAGTPHADIVDWAYDGAERVSLKGCLKRLRRQK